MRAVGEATGPWLPLHQVVKTVLSELRNRTAAEKPGPEKSRGGLRQRRAETELEAKTSHELASTQSVRLQSLEGLTLHGPA